MRHFPIKTLILTLTFGLGLVQSAQGETASHKMDRKGSFSEILLGVREVKLSFSQPLAYKMTEVPRYELARPPECGVHCARLVTRRTMQNLAAITIPFEREPTAEDPSSTHGNCYLVSDNQEEEQALISSPATAFVTSFVPATSQITEGTLWYYNMMFLALTYRSPGGGIKTGKIICDTKLNTLSLRTLQEGFAKEGVQMEFSYY